MLLLVYAAATVAALVIGANAAAYAWRAHHLSSLPPCDRPERLGWRHTTIAFLHECAASAAAVATVPAGWTRHAATATDLAAESVDEHDLPLDTAAEKPVPSTVEGTRPTRGERKLSADGTVILIHDLGLNAGSFALLRHRLGGSGWPTVALRHPALLTDTAAIAAQLHDLVEEIARSRPRQIVLVAHGFGGLVVRLYARRYRAPLVRRILTLGTAHQGSVLPRICGRAHRLLEPRGQLLSQLEAADRVPQQFDFVALHSTFDATVVPPTNAEYPGAFNIQLNDVGHHTLLFSQRVYELIAENLAAPVR